MAEISRREGEQERESLEDKEYAAFLLAQGRVNKLREEIDQVLAESGDRSAAKKIVLESFAPQMEQALEEMARAFRVWVKVFEKSQTAHKGEEARAS